MNITGCAQSGTTLLQQMIRALRIINIHRDPRDVLTSRHHSNPDEYYVSLHRLILQYEEITWLKQCWDKVLDVKYESILRNPDQVQKQLGDQLQLKREASFYQYPNPNYLPAPEDLPEDERDALEGVRPLDTDHIGRWKKQDPDYILDLAEREPI